MNILSDNYKLILSAKEVEFMKGLLLWAEEKSKNKESVDTAKEISRKIKNVMDLPGEVTYLRGLSDEAKLLFFKVEREYGFDLYHSFAAVINNKERDSWEEHYEYYKNKYFDRRPLVFEQEEYTKEICDFVFRKMIRKNKKTY